MTDYTEAGVRLVADVSDAEDKIQSLLDMVSVFDSPVEISITADAGDLESSITDAIPDSEVVDVTADASSIDGDITDAIPDSEVIPFDADTSNIESEISDAIPDSESVEIDPSITDDPDYQSLLDLDGQTITPVVDTSDTPDAQTTFDMLKSIRNLEAFNVVMNVSGPILDVLNKISSFAVQPLLDANASMAEFGAKTGTAGDELQQVGETIKSIFFDDLGTSIDQVTQVAIAAKQLGVNIDDGSRAALTFTHTFQDQDPVQVLQALNQMVSQGLAPNFAAASDILTVGFQNGANRGGDLIQVMKDQAVAFHDVGLNGQQSMSLITSGLDNGFTSANQVALAVDTLKKNLTTAAGTATSPVNTGLAQMGLDNPIAKGQQIGADFLNSVIGGIRDTSPSAPMSQDELAQKLFGKQGVKNTSAILGMDTTEFSGFDDMKNAAADAAQAIDDSLKGAIDDFMLAAQEAATNFMSSDAIDLPGKIALLKTGLQDALNTLSNGGDLGEALTVALKPIGFDDEFHSLESALGNFVIGILQAVAQLQDVTGHGEQAKGTRATIADMAKGQLAFDLQDASIDKIGNLLTTAQGRGLTPEDIVGTLKDSVDTLMSGEGARGTSAQQAAQAQAILDAATAELAQIPTTMDAVISAPGAFDTNVSFDDQLAKNLELKAAIDETTASMQTIIDTYKAQQTQMGLAPAIGANTATLGTHTLGLNAGGTPDVLKTANDVQTAATTVATAQTAQATNTTVLAGANTAAAVPTRTLTAATQAAGQSAQTAVNPLHQLIVPISAIPQSANPATLSVIGLNDAMPPFVANLDAAAISMQNASDAAAALAAQGGSANIPTKHGATGFDDSGGQSFLVGENGPEIVTSDRSLAVLNNRTMQAIMGAVSGAVGRGSVQGGNSSKVVNFTQNNITQNQAQSDALGYATGQQIRGM